MTAPIHTAQTRFTAQSTLRMKSMGTNPYLRSIGIAMAIAFLAAVTITSQDAGALVPTGMPKSAIPILEAAVSANSAKTLCYAFLEDGDVWTACNGRREKLQLKAAGTVMHYAVSSNGANLALLLDESKPDQRGIVVKDLVVASLGSLTESPAKSTEWQFIRATCGTILGYSPGNWTATDIFNGKSVGYPPDRAFRCDTSGGVRMGWNDVHIMSTELLLQVHGKPDKKIGAFVNGGMDFDVSENGAYAAYYSRNEPKPRQLCLVKIHGGADACVAEGHDEAGLDGMSLSDAGGVLYAGHTGESCYYKDMQHFGTKLLPGYTGEDTCLGIYYWRAGMPDTALVEEVGRYPQWISPRTAMAMRSLKLNE
jgi:hypothetical protein